MGQWQLRGRWRAGRGKVRHGCSPPVGLETTTPLLLLPTTSSTVAARVIANIGQNHGDSTKVTQEPVKKGSPVVAQPRTTRAQRLSGHQRRSLSTSRHAIAGGRRRVTPARPTAAAGRSHATASIL
ncbi:hypothetical protein ZWY2020_048973 [Hordeum vulgare]|nr:hypothetical protein ZWY2020_048973 [Hordeum vulgare]